MKSSAIGSTVRLCFSLDVEDGWPPVAVESLPFQVADNGCVALVAPLFVKGLSVGDVIEVTATEGHLVQSWLHVARSARTTVWLLRMEEFVTIDVVWAELRALGCGIVEFEHGMTYSVDVPESIPIAVVDAALAKLDSDAIAVAFPSMRHEEPEEQ